MAKTKSTKRSASKTRKDTSCEQFMRIAGVQMRRACIPTCVAITASVLISKIGSPIVPVALMGAGGWAWWKGYRVRVVRPGEKKK